MNVEAWFIGYICQALDDGKVNYHHCNTWFRLFLADGEYTVTATKNNSANEVVVHRGLSPNFPIAFRGTLQDFTKWIQKQQMKPDF